MTRIIFFFLILFCVTKTTAQHPAESKNGTWIMWFNSLVINEKWKIDSDFHLRFWQLTNDPNTLLLRAGLTHSPHSWCELTAGYAYIEGYSFEMATENWDASSAEHRLWEQFVAKHKHAGFSFHHRLRIEQRIVEASNNFYQDRIRYRFLLSRPFFKAKPAFYGVSSYEHFFTPKDFKFDQGRLNAGLGYAIKKNLKLEVAYLRHFLKDGVAFNRVQINIITSF